jgi:hypothetical protein
MRPKSLTVSIWISYELRKVEHTIKFRVLY